MPLAKLPRTSSRPQNTVNNFQIPIDGIPIKVLHPSGAANIDIARVADD